MIWHGLTKDEALESCRRLGLTCRFVVTEDPKKGAAGDRTGPDAEPKVIRAKESAKEVTFLIGYFMAPRDGRLMDT